MGRTHDCALDLVPEAFPPDLPPVILMDVVGVVVLGGEVVVLEVMKAIDRCVVMDEREDGEKGARSSCLRRAAGLRSRGARRNCSGFDCEPWRRAINCDVDSATSGLAWASFAPAPAITAATAFAARSYKNVAVPRISSPLIFFSSHNHITSSHRRPSTAHTTLIHHF